ncbi:RDD family protein [Streptomyces sp. NBC_01142]|uniref:RDD family protein n=1 Tax=Streptomyces sp. NBC_01142 TaxID=2975865 RepID=UPI0022535393|nr:RDD family protein [Streptomyces sp. NBC_01142]MCX4821353.1 RDD family protein [Streptomyces sp. NBC_01142]
MTVDNGKWSVPGQGRRLVAVAVDAVLAVLSALGVGVAVSIEAVDGVLVVGPQWGAAIAVGFAFSFLNQVVMTCAVRASIGKAVAGLRVVRTHDDMRPRFGQLTHRWLFGFYWMLVFVPLHVASDSDVEQQDAAGLRVIRPAA